MNWILLTLTRLCNFLIEKRFLTLGLWVNRLLQRLLWLKLTPEEREEIKRTEAARLEKDLTEILHAAVGDHSRGQ
jgi:hypothetical protein